MGNRWKRIIGLGITVVLLSVTIAGCSQNNGNGNNSGENTSENTVGTASSETIAVETEMINVSYDEEDLEDTWEEASAVKIIMDGTSAEIEGEGAKAEDGTVTITSAGTYVVSGTMTDGQLVINAGKEDMVHVVLNGVSITCSNSSAIYGVQSEKLILTLADGTENVLNDGTEYVYENSADDEPNAALFSKDDITINGTGSLQVNGNYQDGIRSKDDLMVVSGTISVTAADDGLKGKDSVVIRDAKLTVDAKADGIKSNNSTEEDKGYVVLEGGTYQIISGNDGIQAETILQVTGGTYAITSGGGSANAEVKTGNMEFSGGSGRGGQMPEDGQTPPQMSDDGQKPQKPDGSQTPPQMPEDGQTPPQKPDNTQGNTTGESETAAVNSTSQSVSTEGDSTTQSESTADGGTTQSESTADDSTTQSENTTKTESTSMKGLKAGKAVFITGGDYEIDAADDTVHSNGNVTVSGGQLTLTSGDDGIHADAALVVEGGTIDITKSYEGLEGVTIDIKDGTINVVASDDGLNAAGGSDAQDTEDFGMQGKMGGSTLNENAYIRISEGYLYVDAGGDGIDSNGHFYVDGGTVLVNGPVNDGNGAFDYNGNAVITGGIVVAIGSSGMALPFSDSSAQNSVMVYLDEQQNAGTTLNLSDEAGNSILSFTSSKTYQSAVISTPDMKTGSTYKISTGGTATGDSTDGLVLGGTYSDGTEAASVTLESSVTQSGSGGMQQGGGSRGQGGRMSGQQDQGQPGEVQERQSETIANDGADSL